MWEPYLTILLCRQSSCSAASSQSHCDSPWSEGTRVEEVEIGGRVDMGRKRESSGQHGVELRVNVLMHVCKSGIVAENEGR